MIQAWAINQASVISSGDGTSKATNTTGRTMCSCSATSKRRWSSYSRYVTVSSLFGLVIVRFSTVSPDTDSSVATSSVRSSRYS